MTRSQPLAYAWRARQIALWILFPTAISVVGSTTPEALRDQATTQTQTAQAEERLSQLVVMLRGTLGEQSFNGAGIIVGRTPDRLYIVTAHHVVQQGTTQADRIEAQFRWLPGEWKKLSILADGDIDLDLAVLAADAREVSIPDLAWGALGDPKVLGPGGRVFPVGFPNAMPWFRPQQAHIVNNVTAQDIHTEGQVFPGNSGGALVTDDWRLIGLVSNVSSVLAKSTRIDLIVEKLKEWRYPVGLTMSASVAPSPPGPAPKEAEAAFGTCAVTGVVLDASSRRPLPGVNVGLAGPMPGGQRLEAIVRTAAITGRDGTFNFACPPGIAIARFPLQLIVWRTDLRTERPNIEIHAGDKLPNVEVLIAASPVSPEPVARADDCIAIRPGALQVENHDRRGGWHVVAEGPRGGQVLLPDFETNENAARTVAGILEKYNVTEYCQVGRPPVVFYFLSRGVPVALGTRRREGPGAVGLPERCRPFDPAALTVAEPDRMTGSDWSIREGRQIIFRVSDEGLGRRALATIRQNGFTSVCSPGRPMLYLR